MGGRYDFADVLLECLFKGILCLFCFEAKKCVEHGTCKVRKSCLDVTILWIFFQHIWFQF